jgi:hypothetical protein
VRIEYPPYFADIVQDTRTTTPIWHCIVQRYGSSSVIAWFQEGSEVMAQQSAETELRNLRRQDLVRAGQLPLSLTPDPDQAA